MSDPTTASGAPGSLCLLRLSALGDVTHMLPIVHTVRRYWPETRLTWIVGGFERRLVGGLPGVEFIVFEKKAGWRAYHDLRRRLSGRRFDALLHMQVALRANLASALVRSGLKIGYDRARSKDLHGLFVHRRIAERHGQHVVDAFFGFLEALGLERREMSWELPVPQEAHEWAARQLPDDAPTLLISPCSSHPLRNWHAAGYARVASHAIERHGMRVVLCGGPTEPERRMGAEIAATVDHPVTDLIGKDTLMRFLALLRRATVLLSPDSGPAHMATCAGTPVIALHAASNPQRSGPFNSREWCVDAYDAAARRFLGRPAAELPWGTKIERPGVMDLVDSDEVTATLDRLIESLSRRRPSGYNAPNPHDSS